MLAARGGADLVALWAQLGSIVEMVAGVALAGIGTGLAVYVARTRTPDRQRDLLRESFRLGLAVALPVALLAALIGISFGSEVSGAAALAGWLAVIPGLVNNYWLGRQRRERMLALALGTALLGLLAAALAPQPHVLWYLAASQALPALIVFFVGRTSGRPRFRRYSHPLRRYVLPGLAIGILGPASLLVSRGIVGEGLSWHEAGVLQALWRLSDWVSGFAAGILSVHFLPRFSALRSSPGLAREMHRAALFTLVPALAVFAALFAFHRPLLALLYEADFAASDGAVALLFAGSLVRIAAWIPLFALYAMRRTAAISIGELFSLPLFACLLYLAAGRLTLEVAGGLWLASYAAYLAFNLLAVRRG